jgi:hypothetical protein
MKILIHQHIRKDVGELTTSMMKKPEWETKSNYNWMTFVNSDIYSIEFEFIWENGKDFKNYWLYVWRFRSYISSYIENILKGEEFKNEIHIDNLDLRLSKIADEIATISSKLDKIQIRNKRK